MATRFGSSKLVERWIAATLGVSVIAALDGGFTYSMLCLSPTKIFHGQLWRLVTWPLVELGPIGLIITCASIYKFGGELAVRWGDRRLRRFVLQIVVAAAVVTCLLAALFGLTWLSRAGGWAITEALTIAWARQFPTAQLRIYGLLVLSGDRLIMFTMASAVVFALYAGIVPMAPELVACAAAAMYPREWLMRG